MSFRSAGEGFRGEGESFAQGGEVPPVARLAGGNMEDQAGNECLGFLVPMGFPGHAGFIEHEGVGQGAGIFRDIEAGRVELVEGIEGGRGLAGDVEGVEDVDRAEGLAGAAGDLGIFALRGRLQITERSAVSQIRDDGSPTPLPVRVGAIVEQMGRAVVAQRASPSWCVAADQRAEIGAGEGSGFLVGGEAGRAVGFAVPMSEMDNQADLVRKRKASASSTSSVTR